MKGGGTKRGLSLEGRREILAELGSARWTIHTLSLRGLKKDALDLAASDSFLRSLDTLFLEEKLRELVMSGRPPIRDLTFLLDSAQNRSISEATNDLVSCAAS